MNEKRERAKGKQKHYYTLQRPLWDYHGQSSLPQLLYHACLTNWEDSDSQTTKAIYVSAFCHSTTVSTNSVCRECSSGRKAETGLKRLKTNFAKPNKNSPLSLHGIVWQGLGISLTKWVIRTWRFLHYALLPFLSLVDEIHSTWRLELGSVVANLWTTTNLECFRSSNVCHTVGIFSTAKSCHSCILAMLALTEMFFNKLLRW